MEVGGTPAAPIWSGEEGSPPRLSAHALQALREFMEEEATQKRCVEEQQQQQEEEGEEEEEDVQIVSEDWRLSQFWYDKFTAFALAQEVSYLSSGSGSPVACIACPSLYVELKNRFPGVYAHLFEYDHRFQRYGSDFTFYDFNFPENLALEYHHAFKVVVADPPYLSEDCLHKTTQTMKLLAKNESTSFILLTGALQCDAALKLLNARPCVFRPSHQSKLGNDFMLFTNYDPLERLGGWEQL